MVCLSYLIHPDHFQYTFVSNQVESQSSSSSSSIAQLFQELLDIHIITVIQSTLEQHREPRLLRIAYILLYELSSFQQTQNLSELPTKIFNSLMNEKILPLTLSVIQWIPIDSETMISALNFLNIVGRKEKAREQLVQTDCIPMLVRFLSMPCVLADVQVLSVALLSRLAKLGRFIKLSSSIII